jgi:transmembrane sensor
MSTPRNHPERPREEFDAIETAAADWLARQEFGLTPEESSELKRWLRQDERHARVLRELQITAAIFDRHPEALARTSGEAAGSPTGRASAPARRSRALRPAAWAALAAALVIGVFLTWRLATRDAREYNLTAQTEIGGLRTLALPDGSVARLNTDSELDIIYKATERRVRLARGEASFAVAKDSRRPFFVEARGVTVRAVGTEFVVRLHAAAVDVLVTEGRVRVENAAAESLLPVRAGAPPTAAQTAPAPVLSAGEKVLVPLGRAAPEAAAAVTEVAPAQIARTLAWRERRLIFEDTPLSEVVAEFNRYIKHRLVIEDPNLGRQKFGGTFLPERHETLVALLEQSFGVVAERRGDTTLLRRRSGH